MTKILMTSKSSKEYPRDFILLNQKSFKNHNKFQQQLLRGLRPFGRSPITNRYRGKAKGCPVFNNLVEISSNMVEQHDECLECLANIENRADLYNTSSSPISISSSSSESSSSSSYTSTSTCPSSITPSPSPSPPSSPDIINELKSSRLKITEEKIRKIKKRPVMFDEFDIDHSFPSTPTTSSGCSPGQHSNTTQSSDQSRLGLGSNTIVHMFQAPPNFVNNLKPLNLPSKPPEPAPSVMVTAPNKGMLNCAICGIKDKPPAITKIYGQNSCTLCTKFFATFLKRPQQLYCAQDGDCLMTFDSRCQACWIKICLQKFDIDEEHRKTGQQYSPKLLSSPNVSLITIDTALLR